MAKLSAVIITLNEQDFIGRCLESIEGLADEIVVVDSFSTDSTEEICMQKGVRFFRHRFEGYVEQKNYALSLASNDLILSLDADEAVSPEMKEAVISVKANPQFSAYSFNRFNNYCGKWIKYSRWYPDRQTRLFDRRKGSWQGLNPHDRFKLSNGDKPMHLKGDILHWYYLTFAEHIEKAERFSSISAMSYFISGRRSGPLSGIVHMSWNFFRSYIVCAGFLDGYKGFMGCAITARGCYLKYKKLRKLQNGTKETGRLGG